MHQQGAICHSNHSKSPKAHTVNQGCVSKYFTFISLGFFVAIKSTRNLKLHASKAFLRILSTIILIKLWEVNYQYFPQQQRREETKLSIVTIRREFRTSTKTKENLSCWWPFDEKGSNSKTLLNTEYRLQK